MGGQSAVTWNPYTPGYFNDPYAHLRECRDTNPVQKGVHGSWTLFNHQDCFDLLRSPTARVSELSNYFREKEPAIFRNGGCPYLSRGTSKWAMYLNGNEHREVRKVMVKAFKQFDLPVILAEAVEAVNQLFSGENEFDLVDYCANFIYQVIRRLYSLPAHYSFEEIKEYSNMIARSQDLFVPRQVYQVINDWFLKGNELFRDLPVTSDPSGYKAQLSSLGHEIGVDYSEEDILSIMSVSVMAAFETSKDSLSMALLEILSDPSKIEEILGAGPTLISTCVEELFRYTAPLQYTIRVTAEPVLVGNSLIAENSKVFLCLASSNRDPLVFENPDELILSRNPNNHLAFGAGNHVCAGTYIARQEMRFCLQPIVDFLKGYVVADRSQVKYAKQIMMRTIESAWLKKRVYA
ncbi:MAG: cytochrome P450 [Chitinophagaceae bacterium]|nr:MAG: cytochrome P450 [Chitinophagaceae bacterium]